MYKDLSQTILLEKDFKEDVQLIKELCELMRDNLKCIRDNKDSLERGEDELYLSINSVYSIQRWAEDVLNKSEHEKRSGKNGLGYSIKHMKNSKASGDS